MRRFLSVFLACLLLWSSISPFVSVTQEVKALFLPLNYTVLQGDQVVPVHADQPMGSFAIAYSSPEHLEYEFEARYLDPSTNLWSAWQPVYTDHDMTNPEDGKQFSQIIFTPLATDLEIRVPATTVVQANFSYLELLTFVQQPSVKVGFEKLEAQALQDNLIVTRQEWGADPKYLYWEEWSKERDILCADKPWYCTTSQAAIDAAEKKSEAVANAFPEDVKSESSTDQFEGHEVMWPIQKSAKITKLFVHHTANLNVDQNKDGVINRTDEEIALRGIYYYHSIVRGWGDIGYNFIVGPTGTIYEGRAGGDKVVAAHAVWRNISSIGVSAMGNFESENVSDSEKAGLANALGYLSKKYSLDPTGTTKFYGKVTPSIVGHRDSDEASTACPGRNLYAQLDSLRTLAKQAMDGLIVTPSGPVGTVNNPAFTSSYIPGQDTISFASGETKTIQVKMTNTGTETWDKDTFISIQNPNSNGFRVLSGDKTPGHAAYINAITPAGDTATFSLILQARYLGFTGNLKMLPVGGGKYGMTAFEVPVTMKKGTVAFNNGAVTLANTSFIFAEPMRGSVTLTNSGNVSWEKEGENAAYIEIGASSADGKINPLPTQGVLPKDVAPGETVTVPFEVLAPLREGPFSLGLTLRIRGDANLFGTPVRTQTTVVHPGEQSRLTLAVNALATPDFITSMDTAGTYVMYVTNTSKTTWENLNMLQPDLQFSTPLEGLEVSSGVFDDQNLEPGKTTALRFPFQTSYATGTAQSTLSLMLGGKNFVQGISKTVTIQEKKVSGVLLTPSQGSSNDVTSISVRNTGEVVWKAGKVRLGIGETTTVTLQGQQDVAPGATATFQVRTESLSTAPTKAQIYLEGHAEGTFVGSVSRAITPTIPLEFGRQLLKFRVR